MAEIGFIGAGNMGGPMLANLIKAGHAVTVFDLVQTALDAAQDAGATLAGSHGDAAAGRDAVITMLPAGAHVREVYTAEGGVLARAAESTLLIDCSTIDVMTAREVCQAAAARGLEMLDAPVSGGVAGAAAFPVEAVEQTVGCQVARHQRELPPQIGGIAETQEMLDYSVANGLYPEVEVIGVEDITESYKKVVHGKAKFRYVIDMRTLDK